MSYGQDLLCEYIKLMSERNFIINYRPTWLKGLEIDIYFPEINVGIEFNGDQHYYETTFGDPLKQMENDMKKHEICKSLGVKIIVLDASHLIDSMIRGKINHIRPRVFNKELIKSNKSQLKLLNKKSSEYRKLLVEKYDSPTARRKNSKARTNAEINNPLKIVYLKVSHKNISGVSKSGALYNSSIKRWYIMGDTHDISLFQKWL